MTIAVLCAIAGGSLGGSLAAIRLHPTPPDTPPAAPRTTPVAATTSAAPAPTVAQPHAPDPQAVLVIQMRAVLGRVAEWSRSHPDEPCPDAATLGIAALDPWGHPIGLTCTDQPADQIMGAISTGPDGIAGNSDDVKSWNLGPSVTKLVQGERWPARPTAAKPSRRRPSSERSTTILRTPSAPPSAPHTEPPAPNRAASPTVAPSPPLDAGDDIPTRR